MVDMLFETFGHLRGLDMRKKRKNLMRQTRVSDKIIANKDKIYRISDPIQLAEIFYPAKNAGHRRAAFLAIFFEIKNAKDQRLVPRYWASPMRGDLGKFRKLEKMNR